MRILFDECVPRQLRRHLIGHSVATVPGRGWSGIKNGKLLDLADAEFDVFLTVDKSIPFQQNLSNRQIAVLVLLAPDTKFGTLQPLTPLIQDILKTIKSGEVVRVGE